MILAKFWFTTLHSSIFEKAKVLVGEIKYDFACNYSMIINIIRPTSDVVDEYFLITLDHNTLLFPRPDSIPSSFPLLSIRICRTQSFEAILL